MADRQIRESLEPEPKDDGKIARLRKATPEELASYPGEGIPTGQVRSDGRLLVKPPKRKTQKMEMSGVAAP